MNLNINIRISHEWPQGQAAWATVKDLKDSELRTKEVIMATQAETVEQLQALVNQASKILSESQATRAAVDAATARIAELEALLQNQTGIPQEVTAKIAELAAALQVVDDTVPDAV